MLDIGLLTKRTVNEWLMTYTDPLMVLLQQTATNTTLMKNDTSQNEVYLNTKPMKMNTGMIM